MSNTCPNCCHSSLAAHMYWNRFKYFERVWYQITFEGFLQERNWEAQFFVFSWLIISISISLIYFYINAALTLHSCSSLYHSSWSIIIFICQCSAHCTVIHFVVMFVVSGQPQDERVSVVIYVTAVIKSQFVFFHLLKLIRKKYLESTKTSVSRSEKPNDGYKALISIIRNQEFKRAGYTVI